MEIHKLIKLKPREEVLRVVHASVVPYTWRFTLLTIFLVLPFFFLFPLLRQGTWGVTVFVIWLIAALILIMRAYLIWARTIFIVTDMRVVDLDQKGFFNRVVSESRYQQIDEVTYGVKGMFPTFFGYGTVRLHLHGAAADIEFLHVKKPAVIYDLINDLRSQAKQEINAST